MGGNFNSRDYRDGNNIGGNMGGGRGGMDRNNDRNNDRNMDRNNDRMVCFLINKNRKLGSVSSGVSRKLQTERFQILR